VPVGDPPTGLAVTLVVEAASGLAQYALPIPLGESPGGTGQWPVLVRLGVSVRRRVRVPPWWSFRQ